MSYWLMLTVSDHHCPARNLKGYTKIQRHHRSGYQTLLIWGSYCCNRSRQPGHRRVWGESGTASRIDCGRRRGQEWQYSQLLKLRQMRGSVCPRGRYPLGWSWPGWKHDKVLWNESMNRLCLSSVRCSPCATLIIEALSTEQQSWRRRLSSVVRASVNPGFSETNAWT